MTVGCPELNEAMNPLADTLETVRLTLAATVGAALDEGELEASSDADLLGAMATAAAVIRQMEAVLVVGTGQVQERSEAASRDGRLTTRMGCRSVSELIQR